VRHNSFTNIHINTSQRKNQHGRGSNRPHIPPAYIARHENV
jgi:hypothetical protein